MNYTKQQLLEDVDFLVARANKAGHVIFDDKLRDTGMSSNELVRFAYTGEHDGIWPADVHDYAACVRAVAALPEHRATHQVYAKMHEAETKIRYKEKTDG